MVTVSKAIPASAHMPWLLTHGPDISEVIVHFSKRVLNYWNVTFSTSWKHWKVLSSLWVWLNGAVLLLVQRSHLYPRHAYSWWFQHPSLQSVTGRSGILDSLDWLSLWQGRQTASTLWTKWEGHCPLASLKGFKNPSASISSTWTAPECSNVTSFCTDDGQTQLTCQLFCIFIILSLKTTSVCMTEWSISHPYCWGPAKTFLLLLDDVLRTSRE